MFSRNRLFFIFVALFLFTGSSKNVFSAEDQPAFDTIAKDIQAAVKTLEYPDQVGQDLVNLVKDWKCVAWEQKLSQAKQDLEAKKITADQAAEIENDVAKELFQQIGKEIASDDDPLRYFPLAKVLQDKKANTVGYCQVYSIVGNAIGLSIKCIYSFEPSNEPLPSKKRHLNCCLDLSNGKSAVADFSCNLFSKPFILKEEFTEEGNYWEAKDKNLLGIHSRIQVWDNKGLASIVYLYRGMEIRKPEQAKDALTNFAKAVELNPKYTLAYVNRGLAYSRLRQHDEALADAAKAIELDPKSPEAYSCRGFAYFSADKITDATAAFDKSLSLNPKYVHAYYGRGMAYAKSGQYPEALADFDKTIELDPKYANGYYGRGRVEIYSGKLEEAKKDLLKAVELEPEMKDNIKALSDYYSLDLFPIL